MLLVIQHMKFHLRTGFGNSGDSYSSKDENKPYQGPFQGNGAASGLFRIVSAFILN